MRRRRPRGTGASDERPAAAPSAGLIRASAAWLKQRRDTSRGSAPTAPPTAAAADTGARARLRRIEVASLAVAKAAGLLNVVVALISDRAWISSVLGCFILAGVLAAVAVVTVAGCALARRVRPGLITLDLLVVVAALFVNAPLARQATSAGWSYFVYPYSLLSTIGIGVAYRRLSTVAGATLLLIGAYLTAVTLYWGPDGNYLPNIASYLALGPVTWLVAREVNRLAVLADAARESAEVLARGQERARHHRILHDRVLQTFDMLLRGGRIADNELRDHLATESAWLRHLVETGDERTGDDLVAALDSVAARFGRQGLKVEVNTAALAIADSPHRGLRREQTAALADAAAEALANTLKHSGADRAVVRARLRADSILVTVTDAGVGFDPGARRRVSGLEYSVARRLAAVGGRAALDSAPGAGTSVELSVPLPG